VAKGPRRWNDRWEWVEDLGGGGQAHTFMVKDLTDGSTGWVLKRLNNPNRIGRFQREVDAQSKLDSPHIPPVKDYFVTEEKGKSFLVTPYVGENLMDTADEELAPRELLERFHGVVEAVHAAHAKGVVHRDIKPDNVVVDEAGTPFLVDFGICADDGSQVILTTVEGFGNASFAAPECDRGSVEAAAEPSDIYSLGKLLYWMATSGRERRFMRREDFDRDSLTIADPIAQQYVSVLIDRSVREDPGSRWSVTELRHGVDWALAKLAEHATVREQGLTVLVDGFGPNDSCYESGSRSARTGHGDPPTDYEIAQSFFVGRAVVLERLDIGLALRHGLGEVDIKLIEGGDEVPSDGADDVLEQWRRNVTAPANSLQVLKLSPLSEKPLRPQEVYWVTLSACGDHSDVAWISAAIELVPQLSRFADRPRGSDWTPRVSTRGPGLALRVLARSVDTGDSTTPR
jgi:serine/threonine protein kinase